MSAAGYPYSQSNRLEERNTYFYSAYLGADFFRFWRQDRAQARSALPAPRPPCPPPTARPDGRQGWCCAQLLAYLLGQPQLEAADRLLFERLLQRFEVGKRLYRRYDADLRLQPDSGYDDLALYLQFAALCLAQRGQPHDLRYLNALLKCLDTLISVRAQLSAELGAQLAWLIDGEADWVAQQAAAAGVALP